MENIISCVAAGALVMIGKKNNGLKLMEDDNPEMLLIECYSHRKFSCQKYFTSFICHCSRGINFQPISSLYAVNRQEIS